MLFTCFFVLTVLVCLCVLPFCPSYVFPSGEHNTFFLLTCVRVCLWLYVTEKLLPKFKLYTIDPVTRYPNLNRRVAKAGEVQPNYWRDEMFGSDSSSRESEDERMTPNPSPCPSPASSPLISRAKEQGTPSQKTSHDKRGKALWRRGRYKLMGLPFRLWLWLALLVFLLSWWFVLSPPHLEWPP